MIQEIFFNVIANLIATLILTIFSLATIFFFFILERQKFLNFLGINSQNPQLSIYVSRLEIQPGGTKGFEQLTEGYFGPGIIRIEYKGALIVRDALRVRFLARLPKGLQDWLGRKSVALINIDPLIDVSPKREDEIPSSNLILIGTGIYNLGTKIYFEHDSSYFEYSKNDQGERIFKLRKEMVGSEIKGRSRNRGMVGSEIKGRSRNRELAVIQKIKDDENKRVVFICAGLGASASYGSVKYLIAKWATLYQKYKSKEFSLCLEFIDQEDYNSDSVVDPSEIYSSSHGEKNIFAFLCSEGVKSTFLSRVFSITSR